LALITASAAISFHGKLEEQAAKFYEDLARNEKYVAGKETFLAFAKENKKHGAMVLMAYRQVITDAMEACFAFTSVNESDYTFSTDLPEGASYSDALKVAMNVEEKIYKFCVDAAECSKGLLADVPQAFERLVIKKAKRKQILKSLIDKAAA
jgi:rubrerythrin